MKKSFPFFFSLLFSTASFAQISNAGFEDWTDNPVPSYSNPDDWTTLNSLSSSLGGAVVFKTSEVDEVYSGSFAAKMITADLFVGVTPGVITNGIINAQAQSIEEGQPINSRPVVFGGWFRYDPVNVDTAFFSVTLTRWDATNGVRETVGVANADIFSTSGLYENIESLISYSSMEIPDTVLIIMGPGNDIEPQVGSTLFADDVYFSNSPAGLETPESIGLSVYPNPASEELRITSTSNVEMQSYVIYSLDGKRVSQGRLNASSAIVDVKSLTNGQYNLVIMTSENDMVNHKFLKF